LLENLFYSSFFITEQMENEEKVLNYDTMRSRRIRTRQTTNLSNSVSSRIPFYDEFILLGFPTKSKTHALYANFQVYPPASMPIAPVYSWHTKIHVLMVQILS